MNCLREAFTLIEMVVVVAVMAIMAAIIVPRLAFRTPQAEWPTILADLNDVVFFARQEAIANQKVYRIVFKSFPGAQPDTVTVEEELADPEKPGRMVYQQVSSFYFNTKYIFHESVKLKALYHGKQRQNDLEEQRGEGYCYVVHDGLVEDILVHLVRKDKNKGVEIVTSFKLMPFFGKFQMYEGLMRPG